VRRRTVYGVAKSIIKGNIALDGTEVPFDFTSVFATLSDAKLENMSHSGIIW
jgi:hypothetical protein